MLLYKMMLHVTFVSLLAVASSARMPTLFDRRTSTNCLRVGLSEEAVGDGMVGCSENHVATTLNPRGGGNTPPILSKHKRKKKSQNVATFSTPKPFVSVNDIAEMTLSDVTTAFQYSIESNRADFDESRFQKGLSSHMKKILAAMDASTSLSRGKNVQPAQTYKRCPKNHNISHLHSGDVDALQFCAAMRIFAEWRVVRQVPEGYKGYAVGMNLGHKDVVQNVAKIENAVHAWIDHNRNVQDMEPETSKDVLRSPTLRELLEHEAKLDVHPNLPRVKEKTAAMGLLWVRRQLCYQTAIFANVLGVPNRFKTTSAAVAASYKEVYDKYHGWAIQKIFNCSFKAAPEAEEIYKFMHPRKLKQVVEKAQCMPFHKKKKQPQSTLSIFDTVSEETYSNNPLERFGRHVAGEWDKLVSNTIGIFGKKNARNNVEVRGGGRGLHGDVLENYIREEMSQDAHQHISVYLDVAKPLLRDLAGLFDEFNMNDPSKA